MRKGWYSCVNLQIFYLLAAAKMAVLQEFWVKFMSCGLGPLTDAWGEERTRDKKEKSVMFLEAFITHNINFWPFLKETACSLSTLSHSLTLSLISPFILSSPSSCYVEEFKMCDLADLN